MPPRKPSKPMQTTVSFNRPAVPAAPVAVEKSEVKGSGTTARISAPAASRSITHDQIAKRAYEIYASRGYAAGDQNADWLEAERQLRAGL